MLHMAPKQLLYDNVYSINKRKKYIKVCNTNSSYGKFSSSPADDSLMTSLELHPLGTMANDCLWHEYLSHEGAEIFLPTLQYRLKQEELCLSLAMYEEGRDWFWCQ